MRKQFILNLAFCSLPLLLTACGKVHGERDTLPVGALPMSQVKAGLPERAFHDAVLSFTQDKTPAANTNGKTQYLSRGKDNRGGSLVIQCADNRCIIAQAYYFNNPITREQALSVLKDLMPDDTEPLSKIDVGTYKGDDHGNPRTNKGEIYEYGTQQAGCLLYGKDSNHVEMVNASTLKPKELAAWFNLKLDKNPESEKPEKSDKSTKSTKTLKSAHR